MVDAWVIGWIASAVIAAAYFAIAFALARSIQRGRQWMINPLASATAFIFFTCAGGHAIYALQLTEAVLGAGAAAARAAPTMYSNGHMWGWDVVTAIVGVLYWTFRRKFPDLVSGAALFEDLRLRQKRAMEINDDVVQGIVQARLSFDLRRDDEGRRALAQTLAASARIADDLEANRPGGA